MKYVKNPQGVLGSLPDEAVPAALKQGYTIASEEEIAAAKTEKEAANHPVQAAGENFVKGAVDTFTSPFRAAGGLLEAGIGPNPVSEGLGYMTGKNALAAVKDVSQGWGGNENEVNAETEKYLKEQQARTNQNPVSSAVGDLGGSIVGMGPLGAMASPVGAGTTRVLGGGKWAGRAGALAEGAVVGAITGAAAAEDQAHDQDSYVKGEQLFASAGLGALLGGGLNLAGKYLGEKVAARRALRAGPELDLPFSEEASGEHVRELSRDELKAKIEREVAKMESKRTPKPLDLGQPEGKPLSEQDVRDWIHNSPAFEPTERAVTPEQLSLREEATAKERLPLREEATAKEQLAAPDPSMVGGSDNRELTENALKVPGKGPAEPEELRAALGGEDMHMRNRQAKVDKLMTAIPPGATPDYILDMSNSERDALCSFVGVPKRSSEATWKALADAVGEREGNIAPPSPAQTIPELGIQPGAPASGMANPLSPPEPPMPNAPPPGNYAPGLPPGGFAPEAATPPNFPQPGNYQGPQMGSSDAGVIGESIAGKPVTGDFRVDNPHTFKQYMKQMVSYVARREAGRLIGNALGGPFGPAGYLAGRLVGGTFDKMGSVISKSASLANQAVSGAIQLGTLAPKNVKLGIEADLVRKHFYKSEKTPEAAFQARQKELYALQANNGELLRNKIADSYGSLSDREKGAVMSTMMAATKAVDYLISKAPQASFDPTSLTPMSDARMPNRTDINDYARVYTAVMDPRSVLSDISTGTVTKDQMSAVANVYPTWYQEDIVQPYGDMLRARDAARQSLLPSERKVADIVLGTNSGVDNPDFVDKYGQQFSNFMAAQNKPQPKRSQPKSDVAQRNQTQTSSMLEPIS